MGVDLLYLDPFAPPELRLVGRFHAAHAHVVARFVLRIAFQVVGVHFTHVAQQVAAHFARVLAHGAVDGVEAPEVAFVEAQLVLFGDVACHQTRRPRPHPGVGQFAFEFGARKSQHFAHAGRVESLFADFARYDHQVVALAALYQVFPVAVEDLAARRVLHHVAQYVCAGQFVVARIEELDVGQPADDQREDQQDDDLEGPHPHETLGTAHMRTGIFAVKMRAMIQMKAADTAVLTTMRSSMWSTWASERVSSQKKTMWCTSVSTTR